MVDEHKTRIIAALDSKEVTEKALALGLSAAVNQHDAEAAKEESATAGRGTHVRQVHVVGWHDGMMAALDGCWNIGNLVTVVSPHVCRL